jgi:hypothetical protein
VRYSELSAYNACWRAYSFYLVRCGVTLSHAKFTFVHGRNSQFSNELANVIRNCTGITIRVHMRQEPDGLSAALHAAKS